MLNQSLQIAGFRHQGNTKREAAIQKGYDKAELFKLQHDKNQEEACSMMLLHGFSLDYTDCIYRLMKQNPLGDIKPFKESFPRYCVPGRCFAVIEDDNEAVSEAISALAPSWKINLELSSLAYFYGHQSKIYIKYNIAELDHKLFDLFPMMRFFIKPDVVYVHAIAVSNGPWAYYPEGQISLTLNDLW